MHTKLCGFGVRHSWQRCHMRHRGRVALVDRPDVPTAQTTVVVHPRILTGIVQVASRLLVARGTRLNRHTAPLRKAYRLDEEQPLRAGGSER